MKLIQRCISCREIRAIKRFRRLSRTKYELNCEYCLQPATLTFRGDQIDNPHDNLSKPGLGEIK